MTTLADFQALGLDGQEVDLADYLGKVVLVVNTASQCGLTPQYEGLQALHEQYGERGLAVLGFPCNQFGAQEPGDEAEIGAFCEKNYGVTFAMMSKVDVNGVNAHPLFDWLRSEQSATPDAPIAWNFAKFLIGSDGAVVADYAPTVAPADLAADIEKALD
ncbi:glutathione peroxidase [Nocardioides sp.]|uniref:glutathione peroxidase n=1 Tax=Nocardioides sp. TaxID=35761 RepID=UPI002B2734B0|nr:glutathione peroxidase [Nocardioides sp.]